MEKNKLDFSGLFNNSVQNTSTTPENSPSERFLEKNSNSIRLTEKMPTAGAEGTNRLLIQFKRGEADKKDRAEIYKRYQENSIKTEALRCEIMQGLNSGRDITTLFLQAVQALSMAIDCDDFYRVVSEIVKSVYGYGLKEPESLAIELSNVSRRLENLEESLLWAEGDDKRRIKKAIDAHQRQINQIEMLLSGNRARGYDGIGIDTDIRFH